VPRIRLTPQRREFFDLYGQASANAVATAAKLVELLERFPDSGELLRDIKELEHEGDRLTHDVIYLLNRTFVTPFDRDDMYRLATAIDDVVDHVEEAADDIEMFKVKVIPEQAKEQARVIQRAAAKLDEAVQRLEGFQDSRGQLLALRTLEDEGDRLAREAVAQLFRSGQDPLSIIRWKDIHERLEEAVDACQSAADVLEAILVKNR
jgi:predicted phosphate transport protein (TIGR00153 family)